MSWRDTIEKEKSWKDTARIISGKWKQNKELDLDFIKKEIKKELSKNKWRKTILPDKNEVYVKDGVDGKNGKNGRNGLNGKDGSSWYFLEKLENVGVNGDFCFLKNFDFFQKINGNWKKIGSLRQTPVVIGSDFVYQKDNENLGSAGQVKTLNFLGSGVETDLDGTKLNVTISGGSSSETFETVSKNLKGNPYVLNYSGNRLVSVVYTLDSGSITKNLNYTGDLLTSIVLSGDTPAGIALTKTLGYSFGKLVSISYS